MITRVTGRRGHGSIAGTALCLLALTSCSNTPTRTAGAARPTTAATSRAPGKPSAPAAPAVKRSSAVAVPRRARSRRATPPAPRPKPTRTTSSPLLGRTVGIDPGHNGGNFSDPAYINRLIWNGRAMETCNTTGTATDGGYTEAQFNFNVASYLAALLTAQGARVVMTRHSNSGVGPCVNRRAQIIDRSGAQVAIDIHADGGPPGGRGFAILEPVADGPNNRVIGASERFGQDVLRQYLTTTAMPTSTYDGSGGIVFRDDLAGLNLTTVPEVLIETGNMRNSTDAAMLASRAFQQLVASALDRAIIQFLAGAH